MKTTYSGEQIKQAVCREFGLSGAALQKKDSHPEIVLPRHIAAYLMRTDVRHRHPLMEGKPALSSYRIAKLLSPPGTPPRHHTSILHSIKTIERMLADPVSAPKFNEVLERIRANYHTEHEQPGSESAAVRRDNALRTLSILGTRERAS